MNHDRFSSLAIINIERDVSNNINAEDSLEIYRPRSCKTH